MTASKAKGTAAETAVVNYLRACGLATFRMPLTGRQDQGDVYIADPDITVEVKNCERKELAAWVDEAYREAGNADTLVGVVWHKRRGQGSPGEWFVTMDGETFVNLLKGRG